MVFKIYSEHEEIRDLTKRFVEDGNKGIAIGAATLTSSIADILDPEYLKRREELTEDNAKLSITARITNKGLYFAIYSPERSVPVIITYEGDLAEKVKQYLGFGPDPDQDACCL